MTTAMAHQEPIHERLQAAPEEPLYHHGASGWPDAADQSDLPDSSPYYNMPKRNKRKNFKPRCAPNATTFSDESNAERPDSPINGEQRTAPAQNAEEEKNGSEEPSGNVKIGIKNFSLLKGAVDFSRRLSTDSNGNGNTDYQNRLTDENKVDSFQRSYIDSLQINTNSDNREQTVINFSNYANSRNFCAKNPFAISQLIKTNSPPRRRDSDGSDEGEEKNNQDINANERIDSQDNVTETQANGETPNVANKILRDYAMNTMKELLGIYGLSSNEVADAISGQIRALEALQGKPFTQLPLSLKRRRDSGEADRLRRSSSATEDEGSTNITPPKTPDNDLEAQRQRALQIINHQSMRLFGRSSEGQEEDGSGSDDGDQTLDLSVSRDTDGQEQSTTSSAGNSVSEFEPQNMLMRKNLEDLANLQMQVMICIHLLASPLNEKKPLAPCLAEHFKLPVADVVVVSVTVVNSLRSTLNRRGGLKASPRWPSTGRGLLGVAVTKCGDHSFFQKSSIADAEDSQERKLPSSDGVGPMRRVRGIRVFYSERFHMRSRFHYSRYVQTDTQRGPTALHLRPRGVTVAVAGMEVDLGYGSKIEQEKKRDIGKC
ncbi:hypothetical protein EVAR_971_1 [Eumeta japonica]|uniref:Uncharacterized protein n=1 Tax=Eumeta variegata TaxID=151549 RepID=A0A4C1SEB0_EUMVA|nr:hypothetical protein EVAR_971_1 [Eumeta japonica]